MDTSATSSIMADKRRGFDVPTYYAPKKKRECFSDNEHKMVVDEVKANAEKLLAKSACDAAVKAKNGEKVVQKVNEEGKKDSSDEISSDGESSTHSAQAIYSDPSDVAEEYLFPGMQRSASSSFAADALDQYIAQCNEQTPSVQKLRVFIQPDSKDKKPAEPKTSVQKLQADNLDGKLEQLITFQEQNNDILKGIHSILSTNHDLQKKMKRLLKINFEMQRSMRQSQKASKGLENITDLRLKSIVTELDDLKETLIEKMQDSPTSDDCDEDPCSVNQVETHAHLHQLKQKKRKLN